jgi:TetR/AcrR family transcriptional regulator of autoinduction and epiphytic fitness
VGVEAHQRAVAAEKRAAILEAARRLFGDQGFERVPVSAVAKAAKVSLATLYKHFRRKEDLFETICQERFERFSKGLAAIPLSGLELEEGLLCFAEAYAQHLRDPATGETLRMLIGEAVAFPHLAHSFLDRFKATFQTVLGSFLASHDAPGPGGWGGVGPTDEQRLRAIRELLGMIEGGIIWHVLLGDPVPLTAEDAREVARQAVRTWLCRYGRA